MKFLEAPMRERGFVAERHGREKYPEAKEPALPGEESARAVKGPQLKIRRERGRHDLGEVLRPLETNALRKLRVLLHVFFDEGARGWTRFARKIHRQQIQNNFPRDVHSISLLVVRSHP